MKKIFVALLLISVAVACGKKTEVVAVLEKNCTGSYIHTNEKYYLICNDEEVSDLEHGTEILVSYDHISECENPDLFICMMVFQFDGNIEIIKIKEK